MSYRRYVARVERRRALLVADLVKGNQLRLEANLRLRDIVKVVAAEQPLLIQDAYLARKADQRSFARFRRERLDKANLPSPVDASNWEEERARVFRQAFVQHQIQMAWDGQIGKRPS